MEHCGRNIVDAHIFWRMFILIYIIYTYKRGVCLFYAKVWSYPDARRSYPAVHFILIQNDWMDLLFSTYFASGVAAASTAVAQQQQPESFEVDTIENTRNLTFLTEEFHGPPTTTTNHAKR